MTRPEPIQFTQPQLRALLRAVRRMTWHNNFDFPTWQAQTGGSPAEWEELLRAESKLSAAMERAKQGIAEALR